MNAKLGTRGLVRALIAATGALLSALVPTFAADTVFTAASVHTVSGDTLSPGAVHVRDGKIVAAGKQLRVAGAKVVDLKGLHVFPGLIASSTSLGLIEIDAIRASRDMVETGDFHPEVRSWLSVNPDSELLAVARANGITHFVVTPQGGVVSGQSGLLALDGWGIEEPVVKSPVALHVTWPRVDLDTTPRERFANPAQWKSLDDQAKDRAKKFRELDEFFAEARAYAKAKAGAAAGQHKVVPAWEAMLPFVSGELPLVVHAEDVRQIKAAVNWAVTNKLKLILAGGRDAWMHADLLATNKVPVIYERTFNMGGALSASTPRDTLAYDTHFTAPAKLHAAGVKIIFNESLGGDAASTTRNLPYQAAQAVAFGLPRAEALRAITLNPAQALGVADRLGSIEAGKDATFFGATGDILDARTQVRRMWISGREVSLDSRHTRLFEKYKARPAPPHARTP
jgi:imidazolonepropionase-like amidohydrolase